MRNTQEGLTAWKKGSTTWKPTFLGIHPNTVRRVPSRVNSRREANPFKEIFAPHHQNHKGFNKMPLLVSDRRVVSRGRTTILTTPQAEDNTKAKITLALKTRASPTARDGKPKGISDPLQLVTPLLAANLFPAHNLPVGIRTKVSTPAGVGPMADLILGKGALEIGQDNVTSMSLKRTMKQVRETRIVNPLNPVVGTVRCTRKWTS